MRFAGLLVASAVLAVVSLPKTGGQEAAMRNEIPKGYFPFAMPWDDTLKGVATDVSFLNTAPAGSAGRIVVRDGRFVDESTGQRVRFLGANLGANDAFPEKPDAERIAKRLAKMGVNVVRLHHLDNVWTIGSNGTLWDPSRPDRQVFDPKQLDKLDYLIAQLKANGIFVNLNLKVSKELTPADGMPESIRDVKFTHQKRIDFFDRRMIDLQKDYARKLLAHTNPYTKMAYTDDPAVAFVEINNENALLGYWTRVMGQGLDTLPEPFRGNLAGLWTAWVKAKYGSDDKVKAAWEVSATPAGPSILTPANSWVAEQHGDATMTMEVNGQAANGMAAPVAIDIQKVDKVSWHIQPNVPGMTLKPGDTYTVRFRARADRMRTFGINCTLGQDPWTNLGLTGYGEMTDQWKEYIYSFTAGVDAKPGLARVMFQLGDFDGKVWVTDFRVSPGLEGAGLQPGQTLAGGLPVPTAMTKAQNADWLAFLVDTEVAYATEMLGFLRNDLGVKGNIALSQIEYGGVGGLIRERPFDFTDAHAYWQHPNFTGGSWDPANWVIDNTPQVNAMADGSFGEFGRLAAYRVAGKPYSVSEYDHPAPSDFAVEMMPTYAAFGSVQDWDILYTFAQADYSEKTKPDRILGYFDQLNHPGKAAFYPATALLFRRGLIPVAPSAAELQMPEPFFAVAHTVDEAWTRAAGFQRSKFLTHRLSVRDEGAEVDGATITEAAKAGEPAAQVVKLTAGNAFTAASDRAVSVAGFVGGSTVRTGPVSVEIKPFGNNFAAYMVVPIDDATIAAARSVLVTVAGRTENQGMIWNAARTSISTNWGHGPTIAEFIPASFAVQSATAKAVYPLDPYGKRKAKIPATFENGVVKFTTDPSHETLWYELAAE